jgi:hypothetical protein
MNVLLSQHDSSDQRERVVSNRAIARIGCGPAALRFVLPSLVRIGLTLSKTHLPAAEVDVT